MSNNTETTYGVSKFTLSRHVKTELVSTGIKDEMQRMAVELRAVLCKRDAGSDEWSAVADYRVS